MCVAMPGRVVSLDECEGALMAEVNFGAVQQSVCMDYIPDILVGEYVVVHVGFAIQRLDEKAALEALAEVEKNAAAARSGLAAAAQGTNR